MKRLLACSLGIAVGLGASGRARGVILYDSATRNTSAPTGALADAGWQYEGQFGSFLGTPIGSQYFITAQHIGGASTFVYHDAAGNPVTYNVSSYYDAPNSDLRIWKIDGTFDPSTIAPLYNTAVDGSEVGKSMLVVGRGTQRGDPIYLNATSSASVQSNAAQPPVQLPGGGGSGGGVGEVDQFRGWAWGAFDSVQSWGTDTVSAIADGGSQLGPLVQFPFGPGASVLSAGDSGGGVFVDSNGTWKLAGVNYGVDGNFRLTPDGTEFSAALFDMSGFYEGDNPTVYVPLGASPVPQTSYASEIAAHLDFIDGILDGTGSDAVPEPAAMGLLMAGGLLMGRRRGNGRRVARGAGNSTIEGGNCDELSVGQTRAGVGAARDRERCGASA